MMWVGGGKEGKAICRSSKFVAEYVDGRYFCMWAEDDVIINFACVLVSFNPFLNDWEWE